MRSIAKLFFLTTALLAAAVAQAQGEGERKLDQFFDGLKTMRAEFVQSLVSPEKEVLEETKGMLWLARPGRFRLEYTDPYEQLYVADGKKIWMYDKGLEQITVKNQSAALANTPALLLSSTEPLEKSFNIKELGKHAGLQWLELKPKQADASFEYVRLALDGPKLQAMEMIDGFGQTTRLYFDKIVRNPEIDKKRFQFTPPKGVDVIGDIE